MFIIDIGKRRLIKVVSFEHLREIYPDTTSKTQAVICLYGSLECLVSDDKK